MDARKLRGQDKIGVPVGKIINKYKVAKHFELNIADASVGWARKQGSIQGEAALDGIYIFRTSVSAAQMDSADCELVAQIVITSRAKALIDVTSFTEALQTQANPARNLGAASIAEAHQVGRTADGQDAGPDGQAHKRSARSE